MRSSSSSTRSLLSLSSLPASLPSPSTSTTVGIGSTSPSPTMNTRHLSLQLNSSFSSSTRHTNNLLQHSPLPPLSPNSHLIDYDRPPPVHMQTRSLRRSSTPPQLRSPSAASSTTDEFSEDEDFIFNKPLSGSRDVMTFFGYQQNTAHHDYYNSTNAILKRERSRSRPFVLTSSTPSTLSYNLNSPTLTTSPKSATLSTEFDEIELNELASVKKRRFNFPSTFPLSALTVIADMSSTASSTSDKSNVL
jgi:hypothetical protein